MDKEKITAAAFKDQITGEVYISPDTHYSAYLLGYNSYKSKGGSLDFAKWIDEQFSQGDGDGFVTNTGRFINREEARQIAENEKQNVRDFISPKDLDSGDIGLTGGTKAAKKNWFYKIKTSASTYLDEIDYTDIGHFRHGDYPDSYVGDINSVILWAIYFDTKFYIETTPVLDMENPKSSHESALDNMHNIIAQGREIYNDDKNINLTSALINSGHRYFSGIHYYEGDPRAYVRAEYIKKNVERILDDEFGHPEIIWFDLPPGMPKNSNTKNCVFKFAGNKEDYIRTITEDNNIIAYILSQNNDIQNYLINELRKNPSLSLDQIKNIGLPNKFKKVDLQAEFINYLSSRNIKFDDTFRRWLFKEIASLNRAAKSRADLIETYLNILNEGIEISDIYDWYEQNNLGNNIFSYNLNQASVVSDTWHENIIDKDVDPKWLRYKEKNIIYGPVWQDREGNEIKEYAGWTIQEVKTKDDLYVEGQKMNHCVGGYDRGVSEGRVKIYSLRDPSNEPHVTIESDDSGTYFSQIRGWSNEEPDKDSIAKIKAWVLAKDNANPPKIFSGDYHGEGDAHYMLNDLKKGNSWRGFDDTFDYLTTGRADSEYGLKSFETESIIKDLIEVTEMFLRENEHINEDPYINRILDTIKESGDVDGTIKESLKSLSTLEDDLDSWNLFEDSEYYQNRPAEHNIPAEPRISKDKYLFEEGYNLEKDRLDKLRSRQDTKMYNFESDAIDKIRNEHNFIRFIDKLYKKIEDLASKQKDKG